MSNQPNMPPLSLYVSIDPCIFLSFLQLWCGDGVTGFFVFQYDPGHVFVNEPKTSKKHRFLIEKQRTLF